MMTVFSTPIALEDFQQRALITVQMGASLNDHSQLFWQAHPLMHGLCPSHLQRPPPHLSREKGSMYVLPHADAGEAVC